MGETGQEWAFPALANGDCELKLLPHLSYRALTMLGGTCKAGCVLTRDEALRRDVERWGLAADKDVVLAAVQQDGVALQSVSYTHLTLPTILLV